MTGRRGGSPVHGSRREDDLAALPAAALPARPGPHGRRPRARRARAPPRARRGHRRRPRGGAGAAAAHRPAGRRGRLPARPALGRDRRVGPPDRARRPWTSRSTAPRRPSRWSATTRAGCSSDARRSPTCAASASATTSWCCGAARGDWSSRRARPGSPCAPGGAGAPRTAQVRPVPPLAAARPGLGGRPGGAGGLRAGHRRRRRGGRTRARAALDLVPAHQRLAARASLNRAVQDTPRRREAKHRSPHAE